METESVWWWLLLKAEVIRPDHKEHLAVNKEHIQMALSKLQIQILFSGTSYMWVPMLNIDSSPKFPALMKVADISPLHLNMQ